MSGSLHALSDYDNVHSSAEAKLLRSARASLRMHLLTGRKNRRNYNKRRLIRGETSARHVGAREF